MLAWWYSELAMDLRPAGCKQRAARRKGAAAGVHDGRGQPVCAARRRLGPALGSKPTMAQVVHTLLITALALT